MDYLDKETSKEIKKKRAKGNYIIAGIVVGFCLLIYLITLVRIGTL